MALTTNLTAFWPLDEASGSRAELVSGRTLTDATTTGSAAGRVYGTAADFSSDYLAVANHADITFANNAASCAFWVYLDDFATHRQFMGQSLSGGTSGLSWLVEYNTGTLRLQFRVCSAASDANQTQVVDGGGSGGGNAPSVGQWYFVYVEHDPTANEIAIRTSANSLTRYATGYSLGVWDSGADFNIGRPGPYFPSYHEGRIGPVMFWQRLLTASEVQEVYNYGRGLTYAQLVDPVDLRASLVSFWELEEANGVRYDSHGINDLSESGVISSGVGKVGTGVDFEHGDSRYLSRVSNPSLVAGGSFTFAAWLKFEAFLGIPTIANKWGSGSGSTREWIMYTSGSLHFAIANGTTDYEITSAFPSGGAAGVWYFVVGIYDATYGQLYLQIDNQSPATLSSVPTINTGTLDFLIGALPDLGFYFDGVIDQVGFWKRALTYSEIQALYNSGAGLAYEDIAPTDLLDGLESFWELEEASGTRPDSHGSNDLTDNNTVLSAAGKVGTAASFLNANDEFLSRASNVSLTLGDLDFVFAGWFSIASTAFRQGLLSQWDSSQHSFLLDFNSGKFRLLTARTADASSLTSSLQADAFGSPSINTLYFIVVWHDATMDTIGIEVNGVADIASYSVGINAGSSRFVLGTIGENDTTDGLSGLIDQVGFWKGRVLTATERRALYNAGAGLSYADILGIVLYDKLDETVASDTDLIRSGVSPSNDIAKLQLTPLDTPGSGDVILRIRHRLTP